MKPASAFGRVYWHFRHEPWVMGWRQGDMPEYDGVHDHDSVWEVDWEGKARFSSDHPTSKPVELFVRPMKKHTRPGDIVSGKPYDAEIIKTIRNLRRKRPDGSVWSFAMVAAKLDEKGVEAKNGKPWTAGKVHSALKTASQR